MNRKKTKESNLYTYPMLDNMLFCLKATWTYLPRLVWWSLIAIVTQVLLPVITMYLPKSVISDITNNATLSHLLWIVFIYTFSLAIIVALSQFAQKYIFQNKLLIGDYYIRIIVSKAMNTDYQNQEKEDFRKLHLDSYHLVHGNESALRNIYYAWIGVFSNVLGFSVYFYILMKLNLLVVAFLILSSFISYVLQNHVNDWCAKNNSEKIVYQQKLTYINVISEDAKSAKDIRLYHGASWLQDIFRNNTHKLVQWYHRLQFMRLRFTIANSSISMLREGVAYAYLLYLIVNDRILIDQFVLYFAAITGFSAWLQGILSQFSELHKISNEIDRLRSFLDYPENYKREGGVGTQELFESPCMIELKDVCYRYPGAKEDTLHHLNLTISPKEHIAIVGLNGAGKTTLIKLICGLCEPTSGEILYNGVPVKEYNRIEYYHLFSAVFQQFSILPLSIKEVIAENSNEHIMEAKVEECLKTAGLWKKVSSLPNGMNTNLDRTINSDGIDLSGGETQKILLARALYKNAPIILLDEPTAALDPIAESKLYETYHSVMRGKTSIFISHRLASTRFCSRILLIQNGEIVEEGTHEQLIAKQGIYYELFETQAKYYRDTPSSEMNTENDEEVANNEEK